MNEFPKALPAIFAIGVLSLGCGLTENCRVTNNMIGICDQEAFS